MKSVFMWVLVISTGTADLANRSRESRAKPGKCRASVRFQRNIRTGLKYVKSCLPSTAMALLLRRGSTQSLPSPPDRHRPAATSARPSLRTKVSVARAWDNKKVLLTLKKTAFEAAHAPSVCLTWRQECPRAADGLVPPAQARARVYFYMSWESAARLFLKSAWARGERPRAL